MAKCGWKGSGTVTFRWWGRAPLPNGRATSRGSNRSRARKQAVCMAALMATAALFAQEPTIRVNVNLVHVIATVKNAAGQLVGEPEERGFPDFR